MHELGIGGIQGKNGKYHSYKKDNGEPKENLLLEKVIDEENHKTIFERHFETTAPNQKWTTDVSEFKQAKRIWTSESKPMRFLMRDSANRSKWQRRFWAMCEKKSSKL